MIQSPTLRAWQRRMRERWGMRERRPLVLARSLLCLRGVVASAMAWGLCGGAVRCAENEGRVSNMLGQGGKAQAQGAGLHLCTMHAALIWSLLIPNIEVAVYSIPTTAGIAIEGLLCVTSTRWELAWEQ